MKGFAYSLFKLSRIYSSIIKPKKFNDVTLWSEIVFGSILKVFNPYVKVVAFINMPLVREVPTWTWLNSCLVH